MPMMRSLRDTLLVLVVATPIVAAGEAAKDPLTLLPPPPTQVVVDAPTLPQLTTIAPGILTGEKCVVLEGRTLPGLAAIPDA